MGDGDKSPVSQMLPSQMPPWAWILIYVAGGGALGVGGLELTHSSRKQEPAEVVQPTCLDEADELKKAKREIRDLKAAHENMVSNFTLLTDLLSKCNSQ